MYHRIILSIVFLSTFALCFAQYGPAVPLNNIPSCFAFNAKDGMQKDAITGQIHFVYRQKVNDSQDNIIFATTDLQGNCTSHVVNGLYYYVTGDLNSLRGAPSLCISGNQFIVTYNYLGMVKQAVSYDNGNNWLFSDIGNAYDPNPLIQAGDDENIAFITNLDDVGREASQMFTNIDNSTNDTPIFYLGPDIINNSVSSNSDIWIKQGGGGTNNGWPTFNAPVYTWGQIHSLPGNPPYESVFRGGLFEHVKPLHIDTDNMINSIYSSGIIVGDNEPDENKITFVTVNGTSYSAWRGTISQNGWDTLSVCSDYPPGNGDVLYLNIVPHIDTVWVNLGGGACANSNMIVNTQLWIRGNFVGKQTWYSPFDIKLVDNITLGNVPIGQEIPDYCVDYVALVSGKKIMIQYGYKDPSDSLRYKPNCGNDADGIFIYASLYALSYGDIDISQDDGCFTFEYQHPHPSTPAFNLNGTVYDKIDLHRRHYPQTAINPWPGNVDLPYYNPLWPESSPYLARGTAHIYGSVYQQRRGYLSRTYVDGEYPNYGNVWNLDLDYCGGASNASVIDTLLGITLTPVNAPGSTGVTGYKKEFHADNRLTCETFGFNPFGLGMYLKSTFNGSNWITDFYKSLNDSLYSKSLYRFWGGNMLQLNNRLLYKATVTSPYTELHPHIADTEKIEFVDSYYGYIGVYQNNPAEPDSFKLLCYNPQANSFHTDYSTSVGGRLNSDVRDFWLPTGVILQPDGQFKIEYIYNGENGSSPISTNWNPQIAVLTSHQFDESRSRISTITIGYGEAAMLMFVAEPDSTDGQLYFGRFQIPIVGNEDNVVQELEFSTHTYPNPFKQNITLQIKTNQAIKADLSIYNIKGQKVRTLATDHLLSKGSQDFTWDGLDSHGNPTSSGIYFLKSDIAGKATLTKLLKIK